ncbi:MAG: hypothetical protein ABIL70_08420 [candidate division WOR-3 bacterium]
MQNKTVRGYTSFVIEIRQMIGEKANRAVSKIGITLFSVNFFKMTYKRTAEVIENIADKKFRYFIGSPGI